MYLLRDDLPDGPVYELEGSGGMLARATGAVWIRFAEGIDARDCTGVIETAGFTVERVPDYAPNGAWVRGDLDRLDALRDVDGVEVVEPEMSMERSFR